MPSKMSLINKQLFLQITRSVGWISIVYFIGLLFVLPINILMMYSEDETKTLLYPVDSLFSYHAEIQFVLMITIPVLLSVFLFRFLHVKQTADLMHAIPLTRKQIFYHYTLSGAVFLAVPVVMIGILVSLMHAFMNLQAYFTIIDVLYWTGTTLLLNLIFYSAGVFVAMMTGISAVQAVLTYIFLLFPVGMTMLFYYNLKLLLYGFPRDYYFINNLEYLSPITIAADISNRPLDWWDAIMYLVLAIILMALALFFYHKRKVEFASEAIAFPNLRAVFKYGVTFCMMLLGGMYFGEMQNESFSWLLFGYVAGTVIGYYLAEMVLQKTWRVFTRIKGLIGYGVVITVAIFAIQSLGFYEKHIPKHDEIKSVYISDYSGIFINQKDIYTEQIFQALPIAEEDNIDMVRNIHQDIITKKNNLDDENHLYRPVYFLYQLKSGNKVARQYLLSEEDYHHYFRTLYGTEEYKRKSEEIFQINETSVAKIKIEAHGSTGRQATIINPNDIIESIHALREDILHESYNDRIYFTGKGSDIEIITEKDGSFYLSLKPTYQKFSEWLEHNDLLKQAMLTEDDVSKVTIAKMVRNQEELWNMEELVKIVENQKNALEITDKGLIKQCLNSAGWADKHQYIAVIRNKNAESPDIVFFDDAHVPDFVDKHFAKSNQ